ncbi:hypothetical protein F5883DRAFT_437103, partial [Diaporthe sp. PMI_573]
TMAETYHRMIIASHEVPIWYNVAAAASPWTMLAGFFVFPDFTSLKKSHVFDDSIAPNTPLIVIASICYSAGSIGLCYLWSEFRSNYFWLLAHIFFSGLLNCISGLLTVLLNVYSARDGYGHRQHGPP